ncbi:MAG: hypothetical protein LBM02_09655 [Lachnospiraceae bacterium]|jgi:hypothetical protein|nr:hypothetical protein [Lachnospiraceae bacterium]
MSNFKSDASLANSAASGFVTVEFEPAKITVKKSDVTAMGNGKKVGDKIFKQAKRVNKKMLKVAKKVPAYAKKVETQDMEDAQMIEKQIRNIHFDPVF